MSAQYAPLHPPVALGSAAELLRGENLGTVEAYCAGATRLTVVPADDDGLISAYEGDVELQDASGFSTTAALDCALIEGLFRQSATALQAQLVSEDRQARKAAKELAKRVNAGLKGRRGGFLLGAGPRGLTVRALPPL